MKTTIEIPDPLFRKAKARAAERGQSLKELVTEALQEKLAAGTARLGRAEPGWMQGFGGLRRVAQGNRPHPGADRRALRSHRTRGSSLILDTNALSAFADGEAGVGETLLRQPRAAIPVIVLGEFRYGIAESRHRADYEAWLDSQLAHFEILVVTDETAQSYAALRVALSVRAARYRRTTHRIAALALQHGLPVLSRDQHFDSVPDLQRASW